jgi:hypothetical protein
MKTYFDKKVDEMKNYWYKRCERLLKKSEKLNEEADKLNEEADEHMANGNELEWEDCLKQAIEKEAFADGIMFTLKELGFYCEDYTNKTVD